MSARRPSPPPPSPAPADAPAGALGGLIRVLRKLLFGHVTLRRDGRALKLGLEERRAAPASAAAPPAPAAPVHDVESAAELAALKALLDARPQARQALPHLRYLEAALARRGAQAIAETPSPVLKKIDAQLQGLTSLTSPVLLQLLGRLSAELAERGELPPEPSLQFELGPSDYRAGAKVEVGEAPLSDFMRAAAQHDEPADRAAEALP